MCVCVCVHAGHSALCAHMELTQTMLTCTHTGVALLSSIALIFTAILVLSSSSSKDERRSESRGFGFGNVMLARVCFHTFQMILL